MRYTSLLYLFMISRNSALRLIGQISNDAERVAPYGEDLRIFRDHRADASANQPRRGCDEHAGTANVSAAFSSAAACMHGDTPKTIIVSAMSAQDSKQWKRMNWQGSIFENQPKHPVWLFTDDEWDESHNRPAFDPKDLPYSVCLVDGFKAWPGLHASNQMGSPIDVFYDFQGLREPHGRLRVKSGKYLIRKMSAMKHALSVVPEGTRLIWVDNDVVFRQSLDAAFENFVDQYDFTYIPFDLEENFHALDLKHPNDDDNWRIESGVIAMSANERTTKLFETGIDLYMGNSLKLAKECRKRDCQKYETRNLYMDDIYVFTLALHINEEVKQGWFSAGCKHGCNCSPSRWKYRFPNVCPSETGFTSPFNVIDYFEHQLHGPYSWQDRGESCKTVDPEILVR